MAVEIEKKYRLSPEQFEAAATDLISLGAEFLGSFNESNLIFSSKDLESRSAVARIRTTEHGSTLTYKRWMFSASGLKRHIEHETGIEDPEAGEEILRELGLEIRIVYEKRRRAWKVRDTEVVLDELPFGLYMEIEGDPKAIAESEVLLGAEAFESEPETYPRLTEKLGSRVEDRIEARF